MLYGFYAYVQSGERMLDGGGGRWPGKVKPFRKGEVAGTGQDKGGYTDRLEYNPYIILQQLK